MRDVKYTMRVARRRFKAERAAHIPTALHCGFRSWARKTYNPEACHGKLALLASVPF